MNKSNSGHLIVVVGPSGAGKDSLLNAAKAHFQSEDRVAFIQRVITRECDPASEIHDSVSEQEFLEMQLKGAFSVCWQANGLYYGLPASVHTGLEQGQLMIANGSRAALPSLRSAFATPNNPSLTIVHVMASVDALAERLANRNRESLGEIQQRLHRNQTMHAIEGRDVVGIDNSGPREVAINQFISLLQDKLG